MCAISFESLEVVRYLQGAGPPEWREPELQVKYVPKANAAKHIRDSQPKLVDCAARTTLTVLAVMFIFEALKIVFFPTIQTWASHGLTILFSSSAAGLAVFVMSARSKHALDHAIASESRYQMLFECSPTGAYLISEDGHILDCNLSFCRLFGYSAREELVGKSIDRLLPSGAEGSLFLALLRTGTPIENMEHRFQRKDGRDVWVLHSAVSFSRRGGSGGPAARGTMVDITERRQSEYKEHRLAALARCANYAVIALTPEAIIENWNRGAERMFGYSAAEVVGRSIGIIASPERPNEYRKILEDVRRGADVEIETTRRGRDGQSFDVALSVSPIRGQSGDLIGVAAIIREISDRKRAERALLRSEAQYRLLFEKNPVPMWVFDRETLQFLSVNEAAIRSYGYREDEFLKMTIADIRPEESVPALLSSHRQNITGLHRSGE